VLLVALAAGGCEWYLSKIEEAYDAAVQDGTANVEVVWQFHELYPDAVGFISYFTGHVNDPIWNSKTFLYGRYELVMQVPVSLTEGSTKVRVVGEPTYLLIEAMKVEDLGEGRFRIRYGDQWQFDQDTWNELRAAGGRIERVFTERAPDRPGDAIPADRTPFEGIRVDQPVPLFDAHADRQRAAHRPRAG
jgi:hypothetical protein